MEEARVVGQGDSDRAKGQGGQGESEGEGEADCTGDYSSINLQAWLMLCCVCVDESC